MTVPFFSKKRIMARLSTLKQERSPHIADWQKITEYIRPNRGIYLGGSGDTEKSHRPTSMVNSTPAVASRVLQAGMISGAASPAYPWFKLILEDEDLGAYGPAREALEAREAKLYLKLAQSNFYAMLQTGFGDSADFGNMISIMDEHPRDIFTMKLASPGEAYIDVDENGDIDTIYIEQRKTAINLVSRWGKEKCSREVQQNYDNGNYNFPAKIIIAIEPNQDFDPDRSLSWRGKPFVKFIFEETSQREETEGSYLEISGYNEWPGPNLRWDLTSGNKWGQGPGLLALGDAAALQTYEFRDAQAVEKAVKPPLGAPINLKNKPISHAPGGVTFYDPFTSTAKVEPLYQILSGVLQALDAKIFRVEQRINEVYFKDLFLMLATTDRREITAREVDEKHEEKLFALGPVLQRTHRDCLSNAIVRAYKIMERRGEFAPAGPELQGKLVGIRYISALAYAQRGAGAASIERFFGFTGNIAQAFPQVKHAVNINKSLQIYADNIGVPAAAMNSPAEMERLIRAETSAVTGPAAAGAAVDAASAAKLLSETDTTRPSALQFLMQRAGVAA